MGVKSFRLLLPFIAVWGDLISIFTSGTAMSVRWQGLYTTSYVFRAQPVFVALCTRSTDGNQSSSSDVQFQMIDGTLTANLMLV